MFPDVSGLFCVFPDLFTFVFQIRSVFTVCFIACSFSFSTFAFYFRLMAITQNSISKTATRSMATSFNSKFVIVYNDV